MKTIKVTPLYPNHKIKAIRYWIQGKGWQLAKGFNISSLFRDVKKHNATKISLLLKNQIGLNSFWADFILDELRNGDYYKYIK